MPDETQRIERLSAVCERTGLSRSTLYHLQSRGEFVKSVRLSANRVGWIKSEVDHWIEQRAAERFIAEKPQ